MRGRKPVPSAVKAARGTRDRSVERMGGVEVEAPGDLRRAPSWLTKDQKRLWRYAVASAPPGLLRLLDASILAVWCVSTDLYRRAMADVEKYGLVVKGPAGPLPNPALAIAARQAQAVTKAVELLGFAPAARARVRVQPTAEGSRLRAFLEDRSKPEAPGETVQ